MTLRRLGLLAAYAVLILGGWWLAEYLSDWTTIEVRPINEPEIHRMVVVVSAIYILATALPFVPGAEIGLGLMAVLGKSVVPLVYSCMVLALSLSYCLGRFVPLHTMATLLHWLGLRRARDFVLRTAEVDRANRVEWLVSRSPRRLLPFLVRHRYVALAVALNTPGNTLIGGGGGIAFAVGMSGLFGFVPTVATIAVAVAPVPLFLVATGQLH